MKILVVNAGSSSLKYQLIDMEGEKVLAKGVCERIGMDGRIKHTAADGRKFERDIDMPNHTAAFHCVADALVKGAAAVIGSLEDISAVGHRIVQGGSIFSESVQVTDKVIADIESLNPLAPLHNPAHVQGMRACMECFGPHVPEVVVFDTAFHQTMSPEAYLYGLPYEIYEKYQVRRYGFHGTSHRFVSARAVELLGGDAKGTKIITCHLGNGSSITAVKDGMCVDTSMGFTPLDGFIMGSRSGAVDPSAVTYIMEKENLSSAQMSDLLNKKSGVLGLSGVSSDDRDVSAAARAGNARARLALDILDYQIKKYIGQYAAAMNGVDA
ncbi:MAG: acetate kinase, partial [Oscillospiraceae bacterium]|nr:acetate kinase [Oscillospiraceae bacterium]